MVGSRIAASAVSLQCGRLISGAIREILRRNIYEIKEATVPHCKYARGAALAGDMPTLDLATAVVLFLTGWFCSRTLGGTMKYDILHLVRLAALYPLHALPTHPREESWEGSAQDTQDWGG